MNIGPIVLFVIAIIILVFHIVRPKFIQKNHILNRVINDEGIGIVLIILIASLSWLLIGNQREMLAVLHQIEDNLAQR